MREHFHLGHVRGEEGKMVLYDEPQPLNGLIRLLQTLLKTFEHAPEAVVLNEKEQLFFRLAVVVEASETDPCLPRDVAHGGRVITLRGEDARRIAQDKLQLLIVARESF